MSDSQYELVLYRLNLDLDLEKVIEVDSTVIDEYILGYRSRKQSWEEKHGIEKN